MKNVLIGIILAGATITVHQLVSEQQGLEITSFLLVLIGSVYYGFALMSKDKKTVVIELTVATLFVLMAVLGLWFSPWLIIVGLFLHGFWDLAHHNQDSVLAHIPAWYIPFCAAYDWSMAAYLALLLSGVLQ